MYKVIKNFHDAEDNEYLNNKSDQYPRNGLKPTEERIEKLIKLGFIKTLSKKELESKAKKDLIALLEDKDISHDVKMTKAELIDLLV
ncbi:hypothetical protein [Facklamia miroungae]|uniref:HeH/LEM domain-containing protein n=1 Tax=Facklamia miroungae TaxID=120956 RepID=A0A1G7NZS9_9LACT|nr:hypothetical protein [Facklamia miroungae]NKZ28531.1 hypothetical protein [Facklamia miroungae]SDF79552.1 hypothetical protein SAMN05421791_10172 [Facklamia miroungae]